MHAAVGARGRDFDVVVILGDTHISCLEHYNGFLPNGGRPVLLVSRDADNTKWLPRFGIYTDVESERRTKDRTFTDPGGTPLHLSYSDLLTIFVESTTRHEAQEEFNARICE